MGAYSRNKGIRAERALVTWLRGNGFPGAERAVRTGYQTADRTSADPGDVTGLGPGLVVSVKDAKVEYLDAWLRELDAMDGPDDAVRLLVHKREYKADPGRWWCWMRAAVFLDIGGRAGVPDYRFPVRVELADAVTMLRACGYGDEPVSVPHEPSETPGEAT